MVAVITGDIVASRRLTSQQAIGGQLGIKQNSVSGRWNRAHVDELLAVERLFRKKIKVLMS
ncbi:hypothetical protein [Mongoliitalea daihaiensis]|uniref:hypothetical protein n=1 Tax=Mongoliitalea daihaiensis TaxID=2782006 RepID=UPI001F1E9A6C|nr:hypothetical protein [Mongoliitalea daihaiensis]UJP64428.1 hypothetical protein IPZ59_16720 [Mongoliitalea daihaiensis]